MVRGLCACLPVADIYSPAACHQRPPLEPLTWKHYSSKASGVHALPACQATNIDLVECSAIQGWKPWLGTAGFGLFLWAVMSGVCGHEVLYGMFCGAT